MCHPALYLGGLYFVFLCNHCTKKQVCSKQETDQIPSVPHIMLCSQHHQIDPPGAQISNPFISNTGQGFSSSSSSSSNGDSYGSPVSQGIIQPRNPSSSSNSFGIAASDSYGISNDPIQEAVNVASQVSQVLTYREIAQLAEPKKMYARRSNFKHRNKRTSCPTMSEIMAFLT